jgi:hypothetical protein
MKNDKSLEKSESCAVRPSALKILGGVALVLGVVGLVRMAPDLVRYIKISTM